MSSALSKQARRILNGALKAADPAEALLRHVSISGEILIAGGQRYSLKTFRNIYVIGAGKAVGAMALAIQRLLGERISGGFLNCVNGETGKEGAPPVRLRGTFWASPVAADGKIYAVNEEGTTFVVKAGDRPELVATNAIGEEVVATPAVADGALYLRTSERLYCIALKK